MVTTRRREGSLAARAQPRRGRAEPETGTRRKTWWPEVAALAVGLAALAAPAAARAEESDDYLRGYIQAVLDREVELTRAQVAVSRGVVTLFLRNVPPALGAHLRALCGRIPGVREVRIEEVPLERARATAGRTRTGQGGGLFELGRALFLFPKTRLFEPLLSDPRWPHFSTAYVSYLDEVRLGLKDVWQISVGEQVPVLGWTSGSGDQWQAGVDTAVFAFFDLGGTSTDLQSADYEVSGYLAYRRGGFSGLVRYFHRSAHLGDEFLVNRPDIGRINLSYEAFYLLLSLRPTPWLRAYGGGAFFYNIEPSGFRSGLLQHGVELRDTSAPCCEDVRPFLAASVQQWGETDFLPSLSVRAGVELWGPLVFGYRQLGFEYFNGYSPHGQFYRDRLEYAGVGIHFYLP